MHNFGTLLKFPLKDEKWLSKVAIGGVFPLIPMLSFLSMVAMGALMPQMTGPWISRVLLGIVYRVSVGIFVLSPLLKFFSMGFVVEQGRRVFAGDVDALPEWKNAKKLFIDGVLYFLIYLGYLIIPILLLMWGIFFPGSGPLSSLVRAMTAVLSVLIGLVAAFFIPMAVCNFIAKDRLSAAFEFSELVAKMKIAGKKYAVTYAIALGMILGIYVFSLLLGVLIIGWILYPFLMFYISIVFAKAFMEIYPKRDPDEVDVDEVTAEVL